MQVYVEGGWHRRTPDLAMTACGEHKIHSAFCPVRVESYEGDICTVCFTPHELAINAAIKRAERAHLNNGETK